MRIISFLPSATEILCKLGLQEQLVGVSHECDFPPAVQSLPKVTENAFDKGESSASINTRVGQAVKSGDSLFNLKSELFLSLKPDLVVTQSLCGVCAIDSRTIGNAMAYLSKESRLVALSAETLEDVFSEVRMLGGLTRTEDLAEEVIRDLRGRIDRIAKRSLALAVRPSVALIEWLDPPFSAGHWNPTLIDIAGGTNAIKTNQQRSVAVSWEKIVEVDPDVLCLACCGFDVKRIQNEFVKGGFQERLRSLSCFKNHRMVAIDGSAYFNRPGPRLVDGLEILANALHPALHPLPVGLEPATSLGDG